MTSMIRPENNLKAYLTTEHYQRNRMELSREINKTNKLVIDRACFAKTPEEKQKLKEAKKKWKLFMATQVATSQDEQKG